MNVNKRKVVTMGGGTGTFAVISALKKLPTDIASIVAVSDSGGSTGRIRDEFGFQPVGDLRQSLAALADPKGQEWIRRILLYRFDKGSGLKGHNLGNLILTALQDMSGSTAESLKIASNIFRLGGKVMPVTEENVELVIYYDNGLFTVGEHILDEKIAPPEKIDHVELRPQCTISADAKEAILSADYIFIGPGDLYASLMAVLVVGGVKEALQQTKAKLVFLANLMTRKTQTHGMTAQDHLNVVEAAMGRKADFVILNNEPIPPAVLTAYGAATELPVEDDLSENKRVIRAPLISSIQVQKQQTDTAYRSLLRHDADKLAEVFAKILE